MAQIKARFWPVLICAKFTRQREAQEVRKLAGNKTVYHFQKDLKQQGGLLGGVVLSVDRQRLQ